VHTNRCDFLRSRILLLKRKERAVEFLVRETRELHIMIQNTHYSQRSEMSVHKFVSIILCAAILQHSQGLPVVVPQEEPLETSTNEVLPRLQNNKGE